MKPVDQQWIHLSLNIALQGCFDHHGQAEFNEHNEFTACVYCVCACVCVCVCVSTPVSKGTNLATSTTSAREPEVLYSKLRRGVVHD